MKQFFIKTIDLMFKYIWYPS